MKQKSKEEKEEAFYALVDELCFCYYKMQQS